MIVFQESKMNTSSVFQNTKQDFVLATNEQVSTFVQ